MQTVVTFDARGPVAQAILTYGSPPARVAARDRPALVLAQLVLLFQWDDVARARVGEVLWLDAAARVVTPDPRASTAGADP